jgi:hypothetical protein
MIKPACGVRYALPGCWETLTENYVANEPEYQLMHLFDSNTMAYVNKRAYRVPTSQRVAQKRTNENSWQRDGGEK